MKKIYGWNKLDEENANLLMLKISDKDFSTLFKIKDKRTSELVPSRAIDLAYNEGRWFLNFSRAKKAMIDELSHEIDWRVEIVSKVRDVTLKNFE